jgi:hypothetical protein
VSTTLTTLTKLVAVLYGDLPHPLADGDPAAAAAAVATLRAAGCAGVQLNLDDGPVAPAPLRFGPGDGGGRPVAGFVSVWTADVAPALAALAELASLVDGVDVSGGGAPVYRVTEHRRLDPPTLPDGARADALANVAVLRRPASMSREDYLEQWLVHHTPVAIRTQATFGYVQNVVEEALTPGAPEIAAIVEELFPMAAMTDSHAFYGSGGDQAELDRRITELMASVARFGADTDLDLVPTSRYLWPA